MPGARTAGPGRHQRALGHPPRGRRPGDRGRARARRRDSRYRRTGRSPAGSSTGRRAPATRRAVCFQATRRRPGCQHEPDKTGEEHESGRVAVGEVGLDDQAGEHDGDRARRCPRPPTSPRSATAGRTAAGPTRSAAERRSARTGRATATNSVVPAITATTTAGRNIRRTASHTTVTLAALINAEPIAVPRSGETLVNGASTSSCSGPEVVHRTRRRPPSPTTMPRPADGGPSARRPSER